VIFTETTLGGVFILELEKLSDKRGFFARSWCKRELGERGLNTDLAQCSVSFNHKKGTLRGMHYQVAPHEESKIVRCTKGAIYDVVIDLRAESNTFTQWLALELNAENRRMLYIPYGMAHGFQTLQDDTEVFYQISEYHAPEYARGVRWDDPAFNIQWPPGERILSSRDRSYPDFVASSSGGRDYTP
jgi:dTDP-4-dehydrorhamnose 3,5-epimerase